MKTLLVLVILLPSATALSQTKISGTVTDMRGNPISLANVFLPGLFDGTSSGEDGSFTFATSETGQVELRASFLGFKDFSTTLALDGHPISLAIRLEEEIHSLDAVTINAGSFTAGDQGRRTVLRAVDIATTAGATADIAGALNTLPGTQKVGETGRLFVRGGDSDETQIFIDGQSVRDAYKPSAPNAPSRGRFLPFMFSGTSFSTGGYSAEYGQALSSVLVLDSKDKAEMTRTDFGLLSVGADVSHTQAWDRGSAAGKIQYTNIRPYAGLIKQHIDWIAPPVSVDGHAVLRQQSGKYGMLKLYGNFSQSGFSLYNHSIDDPSARERFDLTNHYRYFNGSYKNILNSNWMVRGGLSLTGMQNDAVKGTANIVEKETGAHIKAVLEGSLSDKVEIRSGAEILRRNYTERIDADRKMGFDEWIVSTFAESDVYTSRRFVSRGGLRVEYNKLNERLSVDPRFSLGYKTGSTGQVSLAYGKFRQSAKNEVLRINGELGPERADHYILNYQYVGDDRTFRVEGYYKRYRDLVKYRAGNGNGADNSGYGYARGIELFWRDSKSLKNADYWISYSFLDTERNYLDFPREAPPSFASAHNFSVVYKQFIPPLKSQLGSTFSFASGRPYHDPNKMDFNGMRTPAYADLSFNWSYLPGPSLILYLSCTNVTGRQNIFGYEFSDQLNGQGLYSSHAIRPSAPRFLFVGIFLTLSKEKSVNQLPNL